MLKPLPLFVFGLEGERDCAPIGRLIAAASASCRDCADRHLRVVAQDVVLSCQVMGTVLLGISKSIGGVLGEAHSTMRGAAGLMVELVGSELARRSLVAVAGGRMREAYGLLVDVPVPVRLATLYEVMAAASQVTATLRTGN